MSIYQKLVLKALACLLRLVVYQGNYHQGELGKSLALELDKACLDGEVKA